MTNEEIAKAAYDAGFSSSEIFKGLAAFKRMIDSAAAAEREACAQICESEPERQDGGGIYRVDHLSCANAIRARGQQ